MVRIVDFFSLLNLSTEKKNESEESACQTHLNTKCKCEKGFYKYEIDSTTSECRKCLGCGPDEKEKEHCKYYDVTVLINYTNTYLCQCKRFIFINYLAHQVFPRCCVKINIPYVYRYRQEKHCLCV